MLLGSSGKNSADLLKPALARGLRLIGATTASEYRKYIKKDRAFERRFQVVDVSEPSVDETVTILRGLREKYEAFHGVRILDASLVAAAKFSDRYISKRYNPDKSIDLIDEACARQRVFLESQPEELEDLERDRMMLILERSALALTCKKYPTKHQLLAARFLLVLIFDFLWLTSCTEHRCTFGGTERADQHDRENSVQSSNTSSGGTCNDESSGLKFYKTSNP